MMMASLSNKNYIILIYGKYFINLIDEAIEYANKSNS